MRTYSLLLSLVVLTGCPTRSVTVNVENAVSVPTVVVITAKNKEGVETEHQELVVDAASATGVAGMRTWGPHDIPAGSNVGVKWTPRGSSAAHDEKPIEVSSKGDLAITKLVQISSITMTSPEDSKTSLETLASSMNINGKKMSRLVDMIPNLGALLVCKVDGGGSLASIVDRVHVADPTILAGGASFYEDKTITTKKIVAAMSVNVPLYADIQTNMSTEGTYSLSWSLRKFPWDTSVSFISAITALPQQEKSAFAALLEMQPAQTRIFYISGMQVLDKGTFSLVKGENNVFKTSGGVATVYTGEGEYYFDHRSSRLADVAGYVYDVQYTEWGTREAVLAFLKIGTPAPPKPATPVPDQVLNLLNVP